MDDEAPRERTPRELASLERDPRLAAAVAEFRRALRAAGAEDRAFVRECVEALARRRPA